MDCPHGRSRTFRIAFRTFGPFETAIRREWATFQDDAGCPLALEAVSLDHHELYEALFAAGGLKGGDWDVALGGLCLGAILFGVVVGLSGHRMSRTLWVTVGLYVWGVCCLLLLENVYLSGAARGALAVLGTAYMMWAWLPPALPQPENVLRR